MLLNVKEVSERLAVSKGCVYELISSGKLPHARIGCGRGTIRIPEAAVDAFIEDSLQPTNRRTVRRSASGGRPLFEHLDANRLIRSTES